jgi:hypothetical protein
MTMSSGPRVYLKCLHCICRISSTNPKELARVAACHERRYPGHQMVNIDDAAATDVLYGEDSGG